MEERCMGTSSETLLVFHHTSLSLSNSPATMHTVCPYMAFFGEKTESRLLNDYAVVHSIHIAWTPCKFLILLHIHAYSCRVRFHSPRFAVFFVSFQCSQMCVIKNSSCILLKPLTDTFVFTAVAKEREVEGDLILADLGNGLPFRAGSFDGAISVSTLQWLCNADKSCHNPVKRLFTFFSSLFACLVSIKSKNLKAVIFVTLAVKPIS